MATNIQMSIKTNNGYDELYPTTQGSLVNGAVSLANKATQADTLTNSRTIRTNLASTSTASFNGGSDITPGVTGVLPLVNGGTGQQSASLALKALIDGGTLASASDLNSYPTNFYLGACSSTIGYRFRLDSIMTYINNNVPSGGCQMAYANWVGTGRNATNRISFTGTVSSPRAILATLKSFTSSSSDSSYYKTFSPVILPNGSTDDVMTSIANALTSGGNLTLGVGTPNLSCTSSLLWASGEFNLNGVSYSAVILS